MIYISKDSSGSDVVNLTRGDDATLTVPMTSDDGEEYEMDENEYLIFGVKETPTETAATVLEINSDPGTNVIQFTHEDTMNLDVGFYSAEIQLMASDGKRITVWPKLTGNQRTSKANRKNFCLMTEVVRE